jgi:Crp-like helix-turn-helix domain
MLALKNASFASLPIAVQKSLARHLHLREVKGGEEINIKGKDRKIYFPITAIASQSVIVDNGEGVFTQFLGSNKTVGFAFETPQYSIKLDQHWCCSGYAFEISVQRFREFLAPGQEILFGNVFGNNIIRRLTNRLYCAEHHCVRQRLARVLLEALDVNQNNDLTGATHKKFADLLGTRRETVSSVIGKWQECGVLQATREKLIITNRGELERTVCPCYEETLKIDLDVRKYVSALSWQLEKPRLVRTDLHQTPAHAPA